MEKVLTVSIAAYNVEQYIDECLNCFMLPEVRDKVEVLIVDDGATDNTAEKASVYENEYPGTFKVIRKQNGGWGSTLNSGIALATGKYFKQLDGDDFFKKENLNAFLDALAKTDADMILTPHETFISDTKEVVGCSEPQRLCKIIKHGKFGIKNLKKNAHIQMHQCTFKTSMLQKNKVNITEHAFYTDAEFVVKSLYYTKTVELFPMTVYCYRTMRDGQSMSDQGIRKHYKEHEKVIFNTLRFLDDLPRTNSYLYASERVREMIKTHYYFFFCLEPSKEHRKELCNFDAKIRNKYPHYYEINDKKVKIMRMTGFLSYNPFCWARILRRKISQK